MIDDIDTPIFIVLSVTQLWTWVHCSDAIALGATRNPKRKTPISVMQQIM